MEFIREDFNFTEEPIIGQALLIKGGVIDSYGDNIHPFVFYEVGKHKTLGKTCIIPTTKNAKHDFINENMKKQNRFN